MAFLLANHWLPGSLAEIGVQLIVHQSFLVLNLLVNSPRVQVELHSAAFGDEWMLG